MTREEAVAIIHKEYLCVDRDCDIERSCGNCDLVMPSKWPILEAYKMAIKALEQEPKTEQFAKWVAEEIFDEENWEYNKDAFAEIACRKLAKLGIVRAKGDVWELIESQESEIRNE